MGQPRVHHPYFDAQEKLDLLTNAISGHSLSFMKLSPANTTMCYYWQNGPQKVSTYSRYSKQGNLDYQVYNSHLWILKKI